jgi:hypothetical protein
VHCVEVKTLGGKLIFHFDIESYFSMSEATPSRPISHRGNGVHMDDSTYLLNSLCNNVLAKSY